MSSVIFGNSEEIILAGLAHTRDLVLFTGEIITEGGVSVAHAVAGHALAETDNLGTILAPCVNRDECVDFEVLRCCFHGYSIPRLGRIARGNQKNLTVVSPLGVST